MKPVKAQLPRLNLLGADPEPLGTERYERLIARESKARWRRRRALASRRRSSH